MATQYVCDRCKKTIEKSKYKMNFRPYKYIFGLERAAGYLEYDLCYDCMLEIQRYLNNKSTDVGNKKD